MQKSFSIRSTLICLSLLILAIAIVLRYNRERQFLIWYNGPKLVTVWVDMHVSRSSLGPTAGHVLMDKIEREFKNGCEHYQDNQYRDFTYIDCREAIERHLNRKICGNALADNQIDDLTRKLIAMMRLNGERGHQLVYRFTLDTKEPWLYQLWETYEVYFGLDTVQSFLMATKNHQLELLDAITTGRIDPGEFLAWRIGTYFSIQDREFAEVRSRLLMSALAHSSLDQESAQEALDHGECVLHFYRTQTSQVQEGPLSDD